MLLRNVFGKPLLSAILVLGTATAAFAGPRATCYVMDKEGAKVEGQNLDKLLEIASVSKVFTAYWALKNFGPEYRFKTIVIVKPVPEDNEQFDIHLRGGYDPLFNAWQMQYLISELNRLNIKKVRTLSFDERFKFHMSARSGTQVHGEINSGEQSSKSTAANLTDFFNKKHFAYENFRSLIKEAEGINLPQKLDFDVSEVKFIGNSDYKVTNDTRIFISRSLPLKRIAQEMNRSSNNWVATALFDGLGGTAAFQSFMASDLGLSEKDVQFVNGSGGPLPTKNGRWYNRATCSAVLTVLMNLGNLAQDKGFKMTDVMALSGHDAQGDGPSTISRWMGNNEILNDSVIAKSGFVNPSRSLAGKVKTKQGEIYFSYIYEPAGANAAIRARVQQLIVSHGGAADFEADDLKTFTSIDAKSALEQIYAPKEATLPVQASRQPVPLAEKN